MLGLGRHSSPSAKFQYPFFCLCVQSVTLLFRSTALVVEHDSTATECIFFPVAFFPVVGNGVDGKRPLELLCALKGQPDTCGNHIDIGKDLRKDSSIIITLTRFNALNGFKNDSFC